MLSIREDLKEFHDSEAFSFLISNLKGKYLKEFETSPIEDTRTRERAHMKLYALKELEREIERFINGLAIDRQRKIG